MERLQKIIAASGLCSRRMAETWITSGFVSVNGKTVNSLGTKVSTEDTIAIKGRPLPTSKEVVYMLHKPRGVVCSTVKQGTEQIITELVPNYPRVTPIGRLDKDSEGLILLTNNGALQQQLTHPKYEHRKEYWVLCKVKAGTVFNPEKIAERFKKGVRLGDGDAKADTCEIRSEGAKYVMNISVHEGRLHLIRRMCATQGLSVDRLKRVKIGTLELGNLKPGSSRVLTEIEINHLREPA